MNAGATAPGDTTVTLVTFTVGELTCGLPIHEVFEIKRAHHVTRVHGAPAYVLGVVNLRGRIVTVIDLAQRIGIVHELPRQHLKMVIISSESEQIGLLVDAIDNTVSVPISTLCPPPPNIRQSLGKFISSICKATKSLVVVLDKTTIAKREFTTVSDEVFSL